MSKLTTTHKGQFRKKSQKGGQMEVKVEAEQVVKFRNLRNSTGCENSQPCKISTLVQFSSVCGSNFHLTYDTHLRVRLGFFVFESAR